MKHMKKKLVILGLFLVSVFAITACTEDPEVFTITFNSMGGTTVEPVEIEDGLTLTLPADPTRTGYTFAGWYLDDAYATSFSDLIILESITVYAKWDINTFTVTFESNGGTSINNQTVNYNGSVVEPVAPTKEGYAFAGWYSDQALTTAYNFTSAVTANVNLYAKWDDVYFTVSYVIPGEPLTPVNVIYGGALVLPTLPEIIGFEFEGYYLDMAYTQAINLETYEVLADVTVYVSYVRIQLSVTIIDTMNETQEVVTVSYGDTYTPTDPTYDGYIFVDWYTDEALTVNYDSSVAITSDVTIYTMWEEDAPTGEELAALDLALLSLPTQVNASITLPSSGVNGTSYSWSSDLPHLLNADGDVILAGVNTGGEYVTLTLTVNNQEFTADYYYEILVEEAPETVVTSTRNVDFTNLSTEYFPADSNIDLFFTNNNDVPFVDIEAFMTLVDGAIETVLKDPVTITGDDNEEYQYVSYVTYEMTSPDIMLITYTQEYSQLGVIVESYDYTATLDFTNNTFFTENFDFFDAMVAPTSTNFGEGLTFGDSIITEGDGLFIPLGDYRFDLVIYNDGVDTYYLMPFHVANLLFVGSVYYDVYYNGDEIYGVDSYQFLDGVPAAVQAKTSSYNTKSASLAMKIATYDYLVLLFDFFYGLKEVNQVDTYYHVFSDFVERIIYSRDTTHYRGIFDLTYSLDDLHTYHIVTGYYVETDYEFSLALSDLGSRSATYYQSSWAIDDEIEAAFPGGRPSLRITPDGKTAIYVIDGFDVDTPNGLRIALLDVSANYPNVENFIIDLTNNGGGNVGAVWRTLGYMWDDVIYYHSQNPSDGSAVTYEIYDTYASYDYNWFIMTSPVTFSAANLMAATAKEQGIATIIGLNSTGGASSISGTVLPTGDVIFISSTNVISTKLPDGSYESVEYGVQVDYDFGVMANLYDDEYIQNVVNGIVSGNN